jgi:hypothetical protein
MIASLIPIGLFSVGGLCGYKSYQSHINVRKKIDSEKILEYPKCLADVDDIKNIQKNSVMFIPRKHIDTTYHIGSIKLNKIKYCEQSISRPVGDGSFVSNYHATIKKYFKLKETILFPSIYEHLIISNETKVSINNEIKSNSENASTEPLLNEHDSIIKRNIPGYHSYMQGQRYCHLYYNEEIELVKNLINYKNDVFLIVNPSFDKKDLEIKVISDDLKHILDEKYKDEIFICDVYTVSSILTISAGIISTCIFFINKN